MNFVHDLETGEHVVLFHENQRYAEKIQFQFIQDGLDKGQSCMITTHGSTSHLGDRMARFGIEVHRRRRDGLLHIMRIIDPMSNPRGADQGVAEIYERIFSVVDEPFRLVSTTFREIRSKSVYRKEIQLERTAQRTFDGEDEATKQNVFQDKEGTIMCSYPVGIFGPGNFGWLWTLSANHHAAIFAPRDAEGFGMRLHPAGGKVRSIGD
jgi:hypothetical protein